jgi:crotonobetainyl-CoA:carnitine CoA-transferase CaiB-like acyl-CoA transferase
MFATELPTGWPAHAIVREVGLRDGLQSLARIVPTPIKREWIAQAYSAGVREIEVGSFVPVRLLPQLADTAELVAYARTFPGLRATVLVPNLKGAERAIECGADLMVVPLSASHAHSLANLRKTPDDVVKEVAKIRAARDAAGSRMLLEGGVGTAFGCALQGHVDPAEVLRLMQALLDAGADCVSLADTVGYADPLMVRRLLEGARRIAGDRLTCAHFHDTRGLGLANVMAALETGISRFDACLAGIGGCPHAPGASGNVSTEDVAYLLESMGVHTGLDMPRLLALRRQAGVWLEGETLGGSIARAGLPKIWKGVALGAGDDGAEADAAAAAAEQASAVEASNRVPAGDDFAPGASAAARTRRLPLAGIRVVEFTHMVMGPTCGLVLADLGAEVIKVEPIEGDRTRHLLGAGAGFFPMFNRNKKSISLDLRSPAGAEAAHKLCASADIVVENFRPGVMARYALDYTSLSQRNRGLIYVSCKGFLPGPYDQRTALDEVVQMMGGLAYMTGRPGDPLRAGSSVNDIMGGMFGAIGAMGALQERRATGLGQEVQSALFENNVFLVGQHMLQYAVTGQAAAPMPERISAWALYDVFTVKDDGQIFLAAVSDAQWITFCDAFGFDDLKNAPHLRTNNDRVRARPQLLADLRSRLQRYGVDELARIFEKNGLPFAPIVRPEELFDDPHLRATGGLANIRLTDGECAGQQAKVTLFPITLDGARLGVRLQPPVMGEHTTDLLRRLGYSDESIHKLREQGAIH